MNQPRQSADEHGNPIKLPPGCTCDPEKWITQPWPICGNYEPSSKYVSHRGDECAHCEHEAECHGAS